MNSHCQELSKLPGWSTIKENAEITLNSLANKFVVIVASSTHIGPNRPFVHADSPPKEENMQVPNATGSGFVMNNSDGYFGNEIEF